MYAEEIPVKKVVIEPFVVGDIRPVELWFEPAQALGKQVLFETSYLVISFPISVGNYTSFTIFFNLFFQGLIVCTLQKINSSNSSSHFGLKKRQVCG